MVGAVKGSTKKEPRVVGKPSTFMMDHVASKFNIKTSQICMVGDRLETDILFGQNGGCATLLVLSGVTTPETVQSTDNKSSLTITPTRSQTCWLPRTLPTCEWTVRRRCLGLMKIRNVTFCKLNVSHVVFTT